MTRGYCEGEIDWEANCRRVQEHLQHCVAEKKRLREENGRLRREAVFIHSPLGTTAERVPDDSSEL